MNATDVLQDNARHAFWWGVASLGSMLLIGPLALCVAVPALTISGKALRDAQAGYLPFESAHLAQIGRTCAWVTIALSIVTLLMTAIVLSFYLKPLLNAASDIA